MRIECKKFKYLLEFFNSLFPEKKLKPLMKSLKKVQDHFGVFNDLSVQQIMLNGYLNKTGIKAITPRAAAAIGALLTKLNQEQQQVKEQSFSLLNGFLNTENTKTINELCKYGKQ
jgi:CHAD domain-containing protein